MGGFGAVSLFLYKPSVFKAAGSTSGILDISQFHNKFGMERVLGGFAEHAESYRALSPINQLESSSLIGKTLIIDCGTEDFAYRANQAFYDRCKALKINAIWVSQPGTHGSDYWKKSIGQQLLLFARLVRQ
jgi:S-formylglutathione hydrolase FrmB